jgi:hypothetical protein
MIACPKPGSRLLTKADVADLKTDLTWRLFLMTGVIITAVGVFGVMR